MSATVELASSQTRTSGTVLAFRMEGERFAVPVEQVHEILDPMEPTEVPHAPAHAPALVNVRGVIVPLFDIRHRLRIRPRPDGAECRVVVVEATFDGLLTKLAFTADSVEGVIDIDGAAVNPLPPLGSRWPEAYVAGVTQVGADLVVLLQTDTLFSPSGVPHA